jgi:hypothetical protein
VHARDEFEDLESGTKRLIDASSISKTYSRSVDEFLTRCRTGATRDRIDYALMTTGTPPEKALRDFLLRRNLRIAPTGETPDAKAVR